MKIAAVIPARIGSERLKQKMLLAKTGKPLVQHTYERVVNSGVFDEVIIATDAELILDAVKKFNSNAMLTKVSHLTGTDRMSEIAEKCPEFDVLVNCQGDEPEIDPEYLRLIPELISDARADIATLACPCSEADFTNPSAVKVVLDVDNFALYFSRSGIPYFRDGTVDLKPLRHIGIYAYKREKLLKFTNLPQTLLEQAEKLEQLRALENGMRIKVGIVADAPKGIDTQEDYDDFVARFLNKR